MSYIPNQDLFNVEKRAFYYPSADKKSKLRSPGHSGIITINPDGTECVVNRSVSDSYEIHQPQEIFDTFESVATQAGLTIKNVMNNPLNGGLMISALYDNVSFVGESHDVEIVFFTSHDGKYKTFLTIQALRMACFNQIPMLYKGKNRHIFAEKHYKNSLDITLVEQALVNLPESVTMYNARMEQLLDKKLSYADFVEFFIAHNKMNRDAKQFETNMDKLHTAYYNAEGQDIIANDNAYKALHAITWLNTHGGRKTKFANEQRLTTKANDTLKVMDKLLLAA